MDFLVFFLGEREREREQTQAIYTSSSHNIGVVQSPCTSKGFHYSQYLLQLLKDSSKRLPNAQAHLQKTSILKVTTKRLPLAQGQLQETSNAQGHYQETFNCSSTHARDFQCSRATPSDFYCSITNERDFWGSSFAGKRLLFVYNKYKQICSYTG